MKKKPLLITIAGGTASGKTTIAEKMKDVIQKKKKAVLISLDDWYFNENEAKNFFKNKEVNWDNPLSLNWKRLKKDIKTLLEGNAIKVDKFNFNTNNHDEVYTIEPADVIIIEGIFALSNDWLNKISNIKFFVHADSDTRLIRRIKRDKTLRYNEFNENSFMELWIKEIKPSHDKYIAPTEKLADFVINTTNNIEKKVAETFSILIGLGVKEK